VARATAGLFHVSLFPLSIAFLLLLAMPPHLQKKNDAWSVGRSPTDHASFFNLRRLRRRKAVEAKRENEKALAPQARALKICFFTVTLTEEQPFFVFVFSL